MPRNGGYLGTKAWSAWETEDRAAHMAASLLARDAGGTAALYPLCVTSVSAHPPILRLS